MLAHARARRRWRRPPEPGPGSGSGSGLGLGLGSLPGLVLFEPGVAGMGYSATRTKPAPLQPTRQRVSANGSEPPANGCRKTGWAVGPNGCDGSVRTVATVGKMADENALPERYK